MKVKAIRNIGGVKVIIKTNDDILSIPDITAEELNIIREKLYPGYYFSDNEIKDDILEKYLEELELDDWNSRHSPHIII